MEGCAIDVTIRWYQCIINIINVHAPNSSTKRAFFWRQSADGLPIADVWILARDFNMTLYKEDKVGGGMQMVVQGSELVAWDLLMGQMRVKDS